MSWRFGTNANAGRRAHARRAAMLLAAVLVLSAPAPRTCSAESADSRGFVQLSDGTRVEGEIFGPSEESTIRIFDAALKKFREFRLAEIVSISLAVEKAAMIDKFTFKELGWDEKIFSGKSFPRIDFLATATLTTGEKVAGHILGVVYVDDGRSTAKFVLERYMRGEVGRKVEDLAYVKELCFAGRTAAGGGAVSATLKGFDGKAGLYVMCNSSPLLLPAAAGKEGEFRRDCLAPGTYDFFAVSDDAIHFSLSPPPDAGGPMTEAVAAEIKARVGEIEEFFTGKEVLHLAGGDKAARALVRKTRTEKSTYDRMKDPRFHRFEVYSMKKTGGMWLVESRTFIRRGADPEGGSASEPKVVMVPSFAGHLVEAGKETRVLLEKP